MAKFVSTLDSIQVQKMSQFGEFRGCSHVRELHSLVKATVMVRRKKAEVMPQLPPKFRQQVSKPEKLVVSGLLQSVAFFPF